MTLLVALVWAIGCKEAPSAVPAAPTATKPAADVPVTGPALAGTRWRVNQVVLRFDADGSYGFSDMKEKAGTYAPVSGQTVVCTTREGGRWEYTVSPDLSYIAWRDGGGRLGVASRAKP